MSDTDKCKYGWVAEYRAARRGAVALLVVLGAAACDNAPAPAPTAVPAVTATATMPPPSATPLPAAPTAPVGGAVGQPGTEADKALVVQALNATARVAGYHITMQLTIPAEDRQSPAASYTVEGDYNDPDSSHLIVQDAQARQEAVNIQNMHYLRQADGTWSASDAQSDPASGADPTWYTNPFGVISEGLVPLGAVNNAGTETRDGRALAHYNIPLYRGNMVITDPPTLPPPGESPLGYADVWLDPATHLIYAATMRADYGAAQAVPGAPAPSLAGAPPADNLIIASLHLTALGTPVPIVAPR
jgi:hypothetical protein